MTNVKGPLLSVARKGSLAGNVSTLFEILSVFFQHLGHSEEKIRQWTTGGMDEIYIKYRGQRNRIRTRSGAPIGSLLIPGVI